jgi:ribosomal protein S6-L-glutamate ligase RimK-like protein
MNAVLLWGLPEEEQLAAVHHAVQARGAQVIMIDQRRALSTHVLHGPGGPVLRQGDRVRPFGEVTGAYPRPYPCPPPRSGPARLVAQRHIARLEHELWQWTATTTATVVNRLAPSASNSTKPMQTQLARACGFRVPDTLLTNDLEQVRAFAARHGRVIYKGAGAARTFTGLLDLTDVRRVERLSTYPVYFQRHIAGSNVRVHVVAAEVYATEITSDAVDYRRHIQAMAPVALPEWVADACRAVTQTLGLLLAGIDLIRATDGEWYFLEANTSPGFTFFPERDRVAAAIARLLVSPPGSLVGDGCLPGIAYRHDATPSAVALR